MDSTVKKERSDQAETSDPGDAPPSRFLSSTTRKRTTGIHHNARVRSCRSFDKERARDSNDGLSRLSRAMLCFLRLVGTGGVG